MREALEEKSKKLAERTEGAAKYDIFNSRTLTNRMCFFLLVLVTLSNGHQIALVFT